MTTGKDTEPSRAESTCEAPSWRKIACGNVTQPGVASPAEPRRAFAVGLFEASIACTEEEPTKGIPTDSRKDCREPSSPIEPWTSGHTTSGENDSIASARDASTSEMRTS